jgi:hypothetical protein
MATQVSLEAISRLPIWSEDGHTLQLPICDESAVQIWSAVLLMAARDAATCIRYRPWHTAAMVMVVGSTEYEIEPPPVDLTPHMFRVALKWAAGSGVIGATRRWISRFSGRSISGNLTTVGPEIRAKWHLVCWSSEDLHGVEFYRRMVEPRPHSDSPS